MDLIISQQPPDSWDSFPLFQLLNNYLRLDENMCNGRFHIHLRDSFAPQVVRYVDLMENSLQQTLTKGLEREKWETKGEKSGCALSEEIFWKLNALQVFIQDLAWPDEVFANHIELRLKWMACDILENLINKIMQTFQNWEKKGPRFGNATDYIIPQEMCVMINVILETRTQSLKLCTFDGVDVQQYHTKIDGLVDKVLNEMQSGLIAKVRRTVPTSLFMISYSGVRISFSSSLLS